jgi:hypothetical protein
MRSTPACSESDGKRYLIPALELQNWQGRAARGLEGSILRRVVPARHDTEAITADQTQPARDPPPETVKWLSLLWPTLRAMAHVRPAR